MCSGATARRQIISWLPALKIQIRGRGGTLCKCFTFQDSNSGCGGRKRLRIGGVSIFFPLPVRKWHSRAGVSPVLRDPRCRVWVAGAGTRCVRAAEVHYGASAPGAPECRSALRRLGAWNAGVQICTAAPRRLERGSAEVHPGASAP